MLPGGMRMAFRLITNAASHGRSIHTPSNALGRKPPIPPIKGQGVIDSARNAITRILYGAGTGGAPKPSALTRAIHTTQPIRNQLSFPTSNALSNCSLHFARPPAVQRRVVDVGLGTARKFSTARPIFQNLVQNVPVAGRSMYEMDLDIKKKRAKKLGAKKFGQKDISVKPTEKSKTKRSLEADFEKYFPNQSKSEISAILTVPLVPFDAPARVKPSKSIAFVPVHEMSKALHVHGHHSLRITKLFDKLDEARVWNRGAHYEAFGLPPTDSNPWDSQSALCTSLKIVFDGWSAEMVKSVIGEAGSGWCILEEKKMGKPDIYEGPRSVDSSRAPSPTSSGNISATRELEFIMPNMDFSSSFLHHADVLSSPYQNDDGIIGSGHSTPWMSDNLSLPSTRAGSEFGDLEVDDQWREAPQTVSFNPVAFSAEFMRRSQDMDVWSNF